MSHSTDLPPTLPFLQRTRGPRSVPALALALQAGGRDRAPCRRRRRLRLRRRRAHAIWPVRGNIPVTTTPALPTGGRLPPGERLARLPAVRALDRAATAVLLGRLIGGVPHARSAERFDNGGGVIPGVGQSVHVRQTSPNFDPHRRMQHTAIIKFKPRSYR